MSNASAVSSMQFRAADARRRYPEILARDGTDAAEPGDVAELQLIASALKLTAADVVNDAGAIDKARKLEREIAAAGQRDAHLARVSSEMSATIKEIERQLESLQSQRHDAMLQMSPLIGERRGLAERVRRARRELDQLRQRHRLAFGLSELPPAPPLPPVPLGGGMTMTRADLPGVTTGRRSIDTGKSTVEAPPGPGPRLD